MSMALAVEKTSKRGGRIVHEKDLIPPPPTGPAAFGETASTPPGTPAAGNKLIRYLQRMREAIVDFRKYIFCLLIGDSEYGGAPTSEQQGAASTESESPATGPAIPSITDLMKNPGKVVLCKVRAK